MGGGDSRMLIYIDALIITLSCLDDELLLIGDGERKGTNDGAGEVDVGRVLINEG
jgi:hypothetical protein